MAETALGLVGPVIEVVKWVGAPIIRQFNYLCCFTTNITTLKHEAEKLDDAAEGLQGQVDRARDNVQVIVPEVETWLTNSKDIKDQKNTILDEVPNVESGCLMLRARFSLSKRAKKATDRMMELRGQCKFDAISHPGLPAATEAVPLGITYEFKSRKQIEEDIMTSLRGSGDVNMIGICGMGGLGKTTMAKIIMNRALKEHAFDEVVMAVVSQPVDKLKIQVEIGGSLGLKKLEEETLQTRVQKLRARLSGTKKILLVLDDIWERLVLEDLGIPRRRKGCTILLTSRNHDVLSAMNVEKVFGMEVLSEEDAWFLFKERAGTCVDDTALNSIAKQVVEECRGLPIALATVGAALKDEKNKRIWKDAVTQLRKANPINIPYFIAEVYNPLNVSYNKLDSEEAKSVFLLCCLFGEDADIRLEYLTYFCMGLGIFEGGIRNLEEAGNRMCALTKMLKSRSLLLDSEYGDRYVRMHDVVRDVCIFIAKQEGYIGHNDCTWISFFQTFEERTKLPTNLRLLFLTPNSKLEEEIKFDNTFLEGISDLHVLSIENYPFTSLPHTTQSLKYLNTLVLSSCEGLKTISVVGEFVNLEILICRDCESVKELPPEIKGLNHLKLLELTRCYELQRIGRGIISSLVGLEELKMLYSFKNWEASDREERENAGLRELEALTNLRCLEIQIQDPALAAENMRLSSKLERFEIRIAAASHMASHFSNHMCNKKMSLEWDGEACLGHWIEMQLLRDTESLCLSGNGANNLDLAKSQNIRCLILRNCETMKNIVRTSMDDDERYGDATVFPHMEFLHLFSLPELEEIWDGPISSNSFRNLKELSLRDLPTLKQFWKNYYVSVFTNLSSIEIRRCPSLRNLGQLSIAGHDCLSQLKSLKIDECEMMEQVFLWNEEDQNRNNRRHITKMFPKLKELELYDLPNLTTFCQGIEGIEFPLLITMVIKKCPKMRSIISTTFLNGIGSNQNSGGTNNVDVDDDSSHLFCQPEKVSFGSLKVLSTDRNPFCGHHVPLSFFNGLVELRISEYQGGMSLFSSSIARNLVSLRVLDISECDEMVQVIQDDEEEEEKVVSAGDQRTLLFPNLQKLRMEGLHKLVTFCEWKCDVDLSSLRDVVIVRCPNMTNFTLGRRQLAIVGDECISQLESLKIEECEMMEQVFLWNEEEDQNKNNSQSPSHHRITIKFPKLKEVQLGFLPNLATFYQGTEGIVFPPPIISSIKISVCPRLRNLGQLSVAGNDCLSQLEVLHIKECEMMEQVFLWNEEEDQNKNNSQPPSHHRITIKFPKLKEVQLDDLPNLATFCQGIEGIVFPLPEISSIKISLCPRLRNLGQLSVAGKDCLSQLEVLHIKECEMMEQVFLWNEEENQRNFDIAQVFSELKFLSLKSLPRLTSLCKGVESFEFPQLAQIQVEDCPVLLQNVVSINLFCEPDKVKMELWNNQPFRKAEYLSLEGDAYRNLDLRVVQKMRWLTLRECSTGTKLVNVTTMDTLFPHLEVLRLVKLTELQEIWEFDGPIPSDSFEKLKELRLEFLPALKHLCQMNVVSIFSKLSSIYIYGCHSLCNLFSLAVTETGSCLLQLKELAIESCDMMEQVFFWNEGENQSNIHIPKLKVLILDSLPRLTSFCKGTESFEFPQLDRKRISRCPLLLNFVSTTRSPDDNHDGDDDSIHLFCKPDNKEKKELKLQGNITLGNKNIQECVEYMSLEGDGSRRSSDFGVGQSMRCLTFRECSMNMTTIATLFPLLEVLRLVNITELEEIWDIDGPKNLNELRLKSLPALKHLWQISSSPSQMDAVSIFNKLSCVYIYGCHRLCNLFSLSMMAKGSCLLQLERLVIESCEMIEQVFSWNEEENRSIHIPLVFPKLKVLILNSLPRLTSFCEGTESFEFPLLARMSISMCPLLENLVSTHLVCKPYKALKHLWQSSNNSPYQMNVVSIFNQLSSIYIFGCDELCNLFSLSMMARGSCLLPLERLEIGSCKMMEQVFFWNEEENQRNIHVEEFPKLKFLSLSFLPRLTNFCKGIDRIKCRQLAQMKILNCPLLESFVYWHEELTFIFNSSRSAQPQRSKAANTALQLHRLKREEKQPQQQQKEVEEEQRKTTREEEEEGRKGEIEEEQNS